MTTRIILAAALALAGCKKDDKPSEPTEGGKGTAGGTKVEPPARPSQNKQPELPPLDVTPDPKKVELGHALFFDKRLSVDSSRSCYSCHQNENGTGGAEPVAIGAGDKKLKRHAPIMWNTAYFKGAFYWDGRSATLEDQAKKAWMGGNMGVPEEKLAGKVAELVKIPGYKALFDAAFPKEEPTADHVVQAIAEYERTLICNDTAYDKFAAGDKAALDEAQQRGLDVFLGKGGCVTCHTPPHFSAAMGVEGGVYFNAGIGTKDKAEADIDKGRMEASGNEADWGAFKPPTLRNVAKSAPYFHDGSAATLEDAVKIMSSGGIENKNLMRALLTDKKLSAEETKDLIAFLGGLTCGGTLEEPKLP